MQSVQIAIVRCFRCTVRRKMGWSDLKECSILVSVIVLFSCMLPRNPKDAFFIVLPNQARISPAVNLIDEPLSQFAIAATD